jgi:hypothetical protein
LSTSIPKPIAVEDQFDPLPTRRARTPRLELLPLEKPIVANANSAPAAVPRPPADASSVGLRANPASSGAPAATTLKRAPGCAVPTPTLPAASILTSGLLSVLLK